MDDLQWPDLQIVVTSIGVAIAVAWAFRRWGYGSVDGHLTAHADRQFDGRLIVTVLVNWNNLGHSSVAIDPRNSRVLVYMLPEEAPIGPFGLDISHGEPLFVQHPLRDLEPFDLEPNTNSSWRARFVLEPDCNYLFSWVLYKAADTAEHEFFWSTQLVWSAPSTQPSNMG